VMLDEADRERAAQPMPTQPWPDDPVSVG